MTEAPQGRGIDTVGGRFQSQGDPWAGSIPQSLEPLLDMSRRDSAAGLLDAPSPGDALATWLRAMLAFSTTKRSLVTSMLATMDQTSEIFSACSTVIRQAVESLLARAQEAGEIRRDVDAGDIMRLSHAITVATEASTPLNEVNQAPKPRRFR